jgi:hypothetical protein
MKKYTALKSVSTILLCLKLLTSFSQNCPYHANVGGNYRSICPQGGSIQIGTNPVNGVVYSWSPTIGLNNPDIANPIASPNSTTIYTLTTAGNNLVENGDFESGNTGFTSNYSYFAPSSYLGGIGTYTVSNNPSAHVGHWCNISNHTPNGNKMLVVDGLRDPQTLDNFWRQSVAILPNTEYLFTAYFYSIGHINFDPYLPFIQVRVNGNTFIDLISSTIYKLPRLGKASISHKFRKLHKCTN